MEFKFQVNHMFKTAKKSMSNEGILYFIQSLPSAILLLLWPLQSQPKACLPAFILSWSPPILSAHSILYSHLHLSLYGKTRPSWDLMDMSEERRCDVSASDAEKLGGHLQIGCLQIEDFSLMRIQRKAVLTRWAVSLGLPMRYRSGGANVCIHMMVERRNSC